jgi:hypothetical protein
LHQVRKRPGRQYPRTLCERSSRFNVIVLRKTLCCGEPSHGSLHSLRSRVEARFGCGRCCSQGKTTALHRLDLAVPHAGQIGAEDIGCPLQHPLFLGESFDVEAGRQGFAGRRQDGDWPIHSAGLRRVRVRRPLAREAHVGQLNMHLWLPGHRCRCAGEADAN